MVGRDQYISFLFSHTNLAVAPVKTLGVFFASFPSHLTSNPPTNPVSSPVEIHYESRKFPPPLSTCWNVLNVLPPSTLTLFTLFTTCRQCGAATTCQAVPPAQVPQLFPPHFSCLPPFPVPLPVAVHVHRSPFCGAHARYSLIF